MTMTMTTAIAIAMTMRRVGSYSLIAVLRSRMAAFSLTDPRGPPCSAVT
jgi:hypothetical protein